MHLVKAQPRVRQDGSLRSMIHGWGDEPDTKDFLEVIAARVTARMRVADIGSGTGILAIAAMKLGVKVTAFEAYLDHRAVTLANCQLNNVRVRILGSWPQEWDGKPFDIAFANLGRLDKPMLEALRGVAAEVWVTNQENQKEATRLG